MQTQSPSLALTDPTHIMTISPHSSNLTLATQNGKILFLDLNTGQISQSGQVFNSQINCLRNTGSKEVLVSSIDKQIFYGQIDQNGNKEGITFSTKSQCFSVDIAEFIVVVGSEAGDVCKYT